MSNTSKITTYKLITDYKNRSGIDMHQCYLITGDLCEGCTEDEKNRRLTLYMLNMLISQGLAPTRIVLADCDLTLDELQNLTDGILPPHSYGVITLTELYNAEKNSNINIFNS